MRQIWFFHGGNSFDSYKRYLSDLQSKTVDYERLKPPSRWTEKIATTMTDTDVLCPKMPNKDNAVYDEWKIYFEKLIPLFNNGVQLVGHSLGAMFLVKYLHETPLSRPARRLILIAPAYNDNTNEDLGSFDISSATGLEQSAAEIHLLHSADDPVVPFTELAKFQADLPTAQTHIFADRGHFLGETFPELIRLLEQK